jgi:hypothetical protein
MFLLSGLPTKGWPRERWLTTATAMVAMIPNDASGVSATSAAWVRAPATVGNNRSFVALFGYADFFSAAATAETSISNSTFSPTSTPPVSSAVFQVRPKSRRSTLPRALKP